MQLNEKEQRTIKLVEHHLFTAPYNLMKKDAENRGQNVADYRIRIYKLSDQITGDGPRSVDVSRIAPGKTEGVKFVIYQSSDFFGMIKDSALATAPDAAARATIKGVVAIGGKKMKEAFKFASAQIADNLGEGESLILAPDEESESVRIALYRYSTPQKEIEKDFFLQNILGNEGMQKLIGILSRLPL